MRVFDAGASDHERVASSRVLTVPNGLSLLRLASLPFVYAALAAGAAGRAFVLFAVFATTDWLDGYVARRFDQVSRLGQLLDPIADRALFIAAGLGAVVGGLVPWWIVALIVARDVAMLAVGALLLRSADGVPAVTRLGKAATFGLMAAFGVLMGSGVVGAGFAAPEAVLHRIGIIGSVIAVAAYWLAAADYARRILRDRH
ncbi:MAG: CDP-alcohol phosphatidyltransferase family protein [Nitriliruptoraceae bacterium]